jgi:hypothetical protein
MRRTQAANCPAEATIGVIGGRWKVPIVWHLFSGTRRFSELRRAMPDVTQKMLTQQLRELEEDGVVSRKGLPPGAAEGGIFANRTGARSLKPDRRGMCRGRGEGKVRGVKGGRQGTR